MLVAKAALRAACLPDKDAVRVLDAYAGEHDLWDLVADVRPDVNLSVLHVESRRGVHRANLVLDNERALASLDLGSFDLIDLDAWGVPAAQMHAVAQSDFAGPVTWTAILVGMGAVPSAVIGASGVPAEWRKEAASLWSKVHHRPMWIEYLGTLGWERSLVMATDGLHLYGAVGVDAWSEDRYLDLYRQIQSSSVLARILARS